MTDVVPPALVVVCGYPASGKTTLARDLARGLRLPLIAKDDIKEGLGDVLGAGDMAWSHTLGRATYEVMFRMASAILGAGVSVVLESNFGPVSNRDLQRLVHDHDARPIRVAMTARAEVLLARYRGRAEAGERHPVHLDLQNMDRMQVAVAKPYEPPDLPGPLIEVDGESFESESVLATVIAALARSAP